MEFAFQKNFTLNDLFSANPDTFESLLLSEAVNVRDKINEILTIGNIDLLNNAHKIVAYIIEGHDQELQDFARQEGIAWARHSIALSFKLEWIQAIRRTIWIFIQKYNDLLAEENESINFFPIELEINSRVDQFLNTFFISYSSFKDVLIKEQQELVENLSVPIIPVSPSIAILPLIGAIDSTRMEILEEKVLTEIGNARVHLLIMDLSGLADMEIEEVAGLKKIIDGVSMMGCNTVITGLRKEIARKITTMGITFGENTKTMGTLQQALQIYLVSNNLTPGSLT